MSGIHQLLLAAGPIYSGTMTVGAAAGGFRGYGDSLSGAGAFGSLTPFGAIKGRSIRRFCSIASSVDLQIYISSLANPGIDFFTGVRVYDSNNIPRVYLTSASSFAHAANEGRWQWGSGSDVVWNSGSTGLIRIVEVF